MTTATTDLDIIDHLKYGYVTIESVQSLFPIGFFDNFNMDYDSDADWEVDAITNEILTSGGDIGLATDLSYYASIDIFAGDEYYIGFRVMTPYSIWDSAHHSQTSVVFLTGSSIGCVPPSLALDLNEKIHYVSGANQVVDLIENEWPRYVDSAISSIIKHHQTLVDNILEIRDRNELVKIELDTGLSQLLEGLRKQKYNQPRVDIVKGYTEVNNHLSGYLTDNRDHIVGFGYTGLIDGETRLNKGN